MLLLRLYFTFKNSTFEMSQCQKLLIVITCLCNIALASWYLPTFSVISITILGVLYLLLSAYGMVMFVLKMYQLIKIRRNSINSNNANNIGLNVEQKRLLYVTTKYTTLLCIAIISTWINYIQVIIKEVIYAIEADSPWMGILLISNGIDSVINIVCLYLQYEFNKEYYDKYCGCLGNCCTYFITKYTLNTAKQIAIADQTNSNSSVIKSDMEEEDGN